MKAGQLVMFVSRTRFSLGVIPLGTCGTILERRLQHDIDGYLVSWPDYDHLLDGNHWWAASTQLIPLNDPDADLSDEEILNKELESV